MKYVRFILSLCVLLTGRAAGVNLKPAALEEANRKAQRARDMAVSRCLLALVIGRHLHV